MTLRRNLARLTAIPLDERTVLTVVWVLVMISIPIVRWVVGDAVLHWGVIVSVILQAAAVLAILRHAWPARTLLRVLALVIPTSWLIEYIGSSTGIPFGAYSYTETLQPQLLGVPLIIPLAWLMMLPPAWAVAQAITRRSAGIAFVAAASLAFTAWDFFLDPQMVGWGYWVWAQPGGYFGIPWVNFLGWTLSAALLTVLARPAQLPLTALRIIYTVTWALQTIGQLLFWGMPGPALVGGVVMGVFAVAAWRRTPDR